MRLRNLSYLVVGLLVACGGQSTPLPTSTVVRPTASVFTNTDVTTTPTVDTTPVITTTPTLPVPTEVSANACPAFITDALDSIRTTCDATQRNQVCYSHALVQVEYNTSVDTATFETPGDIAPLSAFKSLTLLSDIAQQQWGVALLRLQANLPDTLPGQNVTVLLFGGTEFTGDNVQGYYFKSGIGKADCQGAPDSGILVQTPAGVYEIALRVNGADIRLGSTAFLQAEVGKEMRINVVEGRAIVTSQNVTEIVVAGNRTVVPLDDTGNASAPPAPAEPYTQDAVQALPVDGLERPIRVARPSLFRQPTNPGYVQASTPNGDSLTVPIFAKRVGSTSWLTGSMTGYLSLSAGVYDIQVATNPPTNKRLIVRPGRTAHAIVETGVVQVLGADNTLTPLYLSAVTPEGAYAGSSSTGQLALIPGDYDVTVYTTPQIKQRVTIVANETVTITTSTNGTLQILDVNGNFAPYYAYVLNRNGDFVGSTSSGVLEVLPGDYDVIVQTTPETRQSITITSGETTSVTVASNGTLRIVNSAGELVDTYAFATTASGVYSNSTSTGELNLLPDDYDIVVQTAPETRERVTITSGQVTEITIPDLGTLQIVNEKGDVITGLLGFVTRTSDQVYATSLDQGQAQLLPDVYDVAIQTAPQINQTVTIVGNETATITVPTNGTLQVQDAQGNPVTVDGYVYRVGDEAYGGTLGNGTLDLLPGDYIAQINTQPQLRPQVTVTAGQITVITIPPSGTVQIVDAKGNPLSVNVVAYDRDGNYAGESTVGSLVLLAGDYTLTVNANDTSTEQAVTVIGNETVTVTIR